MTSLVSGNNNDKKIFVPRAEPRPNFTWVFVGASGYGKTVSTIQVARLWRKNNPRKKIYYFDPKGDIKSSGILRDGDVEIPRGMRDFGAVLCRQKPDKSFYHHDFLLILDDYKAILTDDRTPASFLDFLAFAREMNVDVILSTHSPALVIERLSYYVTHYSIYFTQGSAGKFSDKCANYVACEQSRILINKYVMTYGKGAYPNFPYIEVSTLNEAVVTPVNVVKSKMESILHQ